MARRRGVAAKGAGRPRRKPSPSGSAAAGDAADRGAEAGRPPPAKGQGAAGGGGGGGFFCCYLLRSLCPRSKSRTYIGFTVNPRRRIRQHNGEITSGAWRTRRGRPWEMVLCIYGFPSNVAALQFEWAWQHPTESLAVRKAAAEFKSLGGIGNKVKLAYTMLNLPSWENMNLTVNFFSSKNTKFTAGCPSLPSQMKSVVCAMEDLQCHAEGPSSEEDDTGVGEEPQDSQEPPSDCSPLRDGHSDHWCEQTLSDQEQQMGEQTTDARPHDVEEDSIDEFSPPMEWSEILAARRELDEPRTSPMCSLSPFGSDRSVLAMEQQQQEEEEIGHLSPLLMLNAGRDDGGGGDHLVDGGDVVDLVTPTPVGRLRRRDCVASVCPKIIDLTTSPIVIQL
ncbi:hypothetical protein U9M48_012236 [Paspalum notatum var. saurae]|uniref:Structure-specific endonuclease subunit SLX1 homolog n=1 Tax=Paspalum notatum var. saurae TaxID=547442 RepID=A0AAQ3WIC4_PASNO